LQYSSFNNSKCGSNVEERRTAVAAAQREVAHLPFDSSGVSAIAAVGSELIENFFEDDIMELIAVLRGE
jgi:hypothetical protein